MHRPPAVLARLESWPATSDADLLRRFIEVRDEEAFAALVRRHGALVLSVCRRSLRHEQDAEDAFQTTFLTLARRAATVRNGEALSAWLFGVARRVASRVRRSATRRAAREERASPPTEVDPVGEASLRELQEMLLEEVDRLSPSFRTAFVLCCLEGKSKPEVARTLGCIEGTISSRLARAREILRGRLSQRGVTLMAALTAWTLAERVHAIPSNLIVTTIRLALQVTPRRTALYLLFVGLLALGVGLAALPSGTSVPQAAQQATAPPRSTDGDPLPAGALARIGTHRLSHGPRFDGLFFSPDGKRLISAGSDDAIRQWDPSSGRELLVTSLPPLTAQHLALTADGAMLAVASFAGGDVRLLDARTGQERRRMSLPGKRIAAVAFSPDGQTLATATDDHVMTLWDTGNGKVRTTLSGHTEQIVKVAFLPKEPVLLSVSDDGTARLWDTSTGRESRRLVQGLKLTRGAVLSPDGHRLAILTLERVQLYDTATGKRVGKLLDSLQFSDDMGPRDLYVHWHAAFSPDGQILVVGGRFRGRGSRGSLAFFSAETGGSLARWPDPTSPFPPHLWLEVGSVDQLTFSPDGKTLAIAGDGTIRLHDVTTRRETVAVARLSSPPTTVHFTEGNRRLLLGLRDGSVAFHDPLTGAATGPRVRPAVFEGTPEVWLPMTFTPDGRRAAMMDGMAHVRVWETATGKELASIFPLPLDDIRIPMTSDGSLVAIRHRAYGGISLVDVASTKERVSLELTQNHFLTFPQTFTPDGRQLLTLSRSSEDRSLRLWDVRTGKETKRFTWTDATSPGDVVFTPDGSLLLSAHEILKPLSGQGEKRILRIFDVASGRELRQLPDIWGSVLACSPDGATLAAASSDNSVTLWEIATGQLRGRFVGHRDFVSGLAFSTDGRLLASASHDRTALVWDVPRRRRSGDITGEEAEQSWQTLGGVGEPAYRGLWDLSGPRGVALLARRLRPAVRAEGLDRWMTDLESEEFERREAAEKALEKIGYAARGPLRRTLEANPSAELRQRATRLLEHLERQVPSGEELRCLRAVEALGHADSVEARNLLRTLAGGDADAWQTHAARSGLRRGDRP